MPAAAKSVAVGDKRAKVKARESVRTARSEAVALSGLRLSNNAREAERSAKWALKITQRAMVKRRGYGSIWVTMAIRINLSCLPPSLPLSHTPQKLQPLTKE